MIVGSVQLDRRDSFRKAANDSRTDFNDAT